MHADIFLCYLYLNHLSDIDLSTYYCKTVFWSLGIPQSRKSSCFNGIYVVWVCLHVYTDYVCVFGFVMICLCNNYIIFAILLIVNLICATQILHFSNEVRLNFP